MESIGRRESFIRSSEVGPGDFVSPGYYDRIYEAPGVIYEVIAASGPFVATVNIETNQVRRFDTRFVYLYRLDSDYVTETACRTACDDWVGPDEAIDAEFVAKDEKPMPYSDLADVYSKR